MPHPSDRGVGSLIDFVCSLNLHRRHLTTSQKAAVALDMLPLLEAEAKERQRLAGKQYGENHPKQEVNQRVDEALPAKQPQANEQTAKMVNVSKQYVQGMKTIAKAAPEKVEQIKKGKVTVVAVSDHNRQTPPTSPGQIPNRLCRCSIPSPLHRGSQGEAAAGRGRSEVRGVSRIGCSKIGTTEDPSSQGNRTRSRSRGGGEQYVAEAKKIEATAPEKFQESEEQRPDIHSGDPAFTLSCN